MAKLSRNTAALMALAFGAGMGSMSLMPGLGRRDMRDLDDEPAAPRAPTEADLERIAKAEAKRARKAAKHKKEAV